MSDQDLARLLAEEARLKAETLRLIAEVRQEIAICNRGVAARSFVLSGRRRQRNAA